MRVTSVTAVPLEPPSHPRAVGGRNSGESPALSAVRTESKLGSTRLARRTRVADVSTLPILDGSRTHFRSASTFTELRE
jgi:hypothetical protein